MLNYRKTHTHTHIYIYIYIYTLSCERKQSISVIKSTYLSKNKVKGKMFPLQARFGPEIG